MPDDSREGEAKRKREREESSFADEVHLSRWSSARKELHLLDPKPRKKRGKSLLLVAECWMLEVECWMLDGSFANCIPACPWQMESSSAFVRKINGTRGCG